mgnify:FL=1
MGLKLMQPLKAARAMRELFADPDDTQQVFEIIEAMQGPALLRMHRRLRVSKVGRRLLTEQPDLVPLLKDRDALRALPTGSLGRAYLDFVESEGITADGLVAASDVKRRGDAEGELLWICLLYTSPSPRDL